MGPTIIATELPAACLLDHPLNDNLMNPEEMRKLRANMLRSHGRTERLVVRELTPDSAWWPGAPVHPRGTFQIISGHQRRRVFAELRVDPIPVDIWSDIADDDSLLMLATFNELRGSSIPAKRAELLAATLTSMNDAQVHDLLVETEEQLRNLTRLLESNPEPPPPVDSPREEEFSQWACMVSHDQKLVIESTFDYITDRIKGANRKGRALEFLCANFLAGPRDVPDEFAGV